MHHETKANLADRGPFKLKFDKTHGTVLGVTCPHNKEPVNACEECSFRLNISESFSSPEQVNLFTHVSLTLSQHFQLTVMKGNPNHVCTQGNRACQRAASEKADASKV